MICARRYDFISHSLYRELILLPKVGWFTADNAANNGVALREFQIHLCEPLFDAKQCYVQ